MDTGRGRRCQWMMPGLWKEVFKERGGKNQNNNNNNSSLHVPRDKRRPGISAERGESTCDLTCHF